MVDGWGGRIGVGSTVCPGRKVDTRLVDGRRSLYVKESSQESRDERRAAAQRPYFDPVLAVREERRNKRLGRGRWHGCVIGL